MVSIVQRKIFRSARQSASPVTDGNEFGLEVIRERKLEGHLRDIRASQGEED